jgi:hypothetical protein
MAQAIVDADQLEPDPERDVDQQPLSPRRTFKVICVWGKSVGTER